MAEKILKLYRDKPFGSALVIEARRRVEVDFNLENMMTKTLALYEEALRSLNILVIKMSAMGDVILSIPSLRAIRSAFPASKIIVLTGTQAREVIDRCPYINDRMIYDHTGKDISLSGLLRTGGRLRRWYFDIAIDLQNNKKSHVLAYLSGAPFRYGYDNGKLSFLLNRRIKDDAPYLDPVEHQFRVLKLAGAKPQDKNLELWPTEADEKKVDEFLNENWVKPGQELVGINVRASSRWHTKNWPASHIAGLCDALAREFGIRVVLTGVKEDIQTAGRIVKETKSKPMIAVGRTGIFELASLMRRFKVYLTADSAPMHIAAAMGTPFVALFGPTDPARHVVRASGCVILKKDLKCSPCYSPRCMKKSRCMNRITVEEVLEAMSAFLKRREEG
jgi:lipopolysaccharide heptosyltransferase II